MTLTAAILILSLSGFSQEELVRLLGSDDVEARERAQKELLDLGAAAIPALERAAKEGEAETRARAGATLLRVRRRVGFDEFKKLDGPARWDRFRSDFAEPLGAGVLARLSSVRLSLDPKRPASLSDALKMPACGKPETEEALPELDSRRADAPWQFLSSKTLGPSIVLRAATPEGGTMWRVRSEGYALQVWRLPPSRGRDIEGIFVLEPLDGPFELTAESVRRLPGPGPVAGLSGIARAEGWKPLYGDGERIERDGKTVAGLYTFHWDQDKPFPCLRHLVVTPTFALFVVGYQ
jgi:hypothetical protein